MTVVNTNSGALYSRTYAKKASTTTQQSMTRLSSGLRVNSAADDAAGLSVSSKMLSQLRSINTAVSNSSSGVSLIQSALSGINELSDIIQRMRELAVQMNNGVYSNTDRANAQEEVTSLLNEVIRISDATAFNGVNILDGGYDQYIRSGKNNSEIVPITIDGMGIFSYIRSISKATGINKIVLRPFTSATGTSAFSTPALSQAERINSNIVIANTATASGTSGFNTPASSSASGSSAITLLNSSSAIGSSAFDYLSQSSGSGTSAISLLNSSSASGLSAFNQLTTSQGTGSSSISLLSSTTATGSSSFDEPASSNASGTSTQTAPSGSLISASTKTGGASRFTSTSFENGDFSDTTATTNGTHVSIAGWDIHLEQVSLGPGTAPSGSVTNIGGYPTPIDSTPNPPGNGGSGHGDDVKTNVPFNYSISNGALTLTVPGQVLGSFDTIHGPYMISKAPVTLEAGDAVSFDYKPVPGGDAYDVYGYLLNVDTGATVELLNETGFSNTTKTSNTTLATGGRYKFVFMSGTFDYSGGRYLGGSLSISNIDVTQANPPPANITTGLTNVIAEEGNPIKINGSSFTSLNSVIAGDTGRTTEAITIVTGKDSSLFSIAADGTLNLTPTPSYNQKKFYEVDIKYVGSDGREHTETVTLDITPILTATSALTAQEATTVTIDDTDLSSINAFALTDLKRGTYTLTGTDRNKFSISSSGTITSVGKLDFDAKPSYSFNAVYTSTDGFAYTEAITLNISDTLTSTATVAAEQSNAVNITTAALTSSKTFAQKYTNQGISGSYSLQQSGSDWNKFNINAATGQITSKNPLLKDTQSSYQFNVLYTTSNGITHNETVTLNLTESLQGNTTVTAQEANTLTIAKNTPSSLNAFASRDSYRGTYSLTGVDSGSFSVDSNGVISTSRQLDFDAQSSYSFDLKYRASDNRTFTETVTLNLSDTLTSTATVAAEQSNAVNITTAALTSSKAFAQKYTNKGISGSYSLQQSGSDWNKFNINAATGQITSKNPLLKDTQSSYQFNVLYTTSNGITHNEAVTLNLTESLQGNTTVTAQEADQISIGKTVLSSLNSFAQRDGFQGVYSISGGPDQFKFVDVLTSGEILSRSPLDFDKQSTYTFDVSYRASDNRTFTETVTLNLLDTLTSTATVAAEQSNAVNITTAALTSSKAFAQKYTNQGISGSYSLQQSGSDWNKFNINTATGQITSKNPLLKDTQSSYQFNVLYTTSNGITHNEAVTLNLTESLQGAATVTAKESGSVQIESGVLSDLDSFAGRDFYRGQYSISGGADAAIFQVTDNGKITSKSFLEFDTQSTYSFEVKYTSSNGTAFTETVNLTLGDTYASTASIKVEQANAISINNSQLASTRAFAQKKEAVGAQGTYQIVTEGSHYQDFDIDSSGNITSNKPILQKDGLNRQFKVAYTAWTGEIHVETVNLTILESLQSTANITSDEANIVYISEDILNHLDGFSSRDNNRGTYSIINQGNDYNQFSINGSGNITSNNPLDFDTQSSFSFKVAYAASDGRTFTQTINLGIKDTFTGAANLLVEEGTAVQINPMYLTSIQAFASKYDSASSKGSYELVQSGQDFDKFTVDSLGFVRSKGELRKSVQSKYDFAVKYMSPDGTKSFTENISLDITDTTYYRGESEFKAKESSKIEISANDLALMNSFASSDSFSGSFRITAVDPTKLDHTLFGVDQTGKVFSKSEIDYESGAKEYQFNVEYFHSDGLQKYVNKVTLEILNDVRDDNNLNLEGVDVSTQSLANNSSTLLSAAVNRLALVQSSLGAVQNRLEHNIDYQSMSSLITETSRGRIMDADFATETAQLSKNLILGEAATAMLAQSNNVKNQLLQLLN